MALKDDILNELLATDGYISGEELAEEFNKTRAAVWKAVKSLQAKDYNIEAVTNKGYRLIKDKNMLSEAGIKSQLKNELMVEYFPTIDSTNTYCKRVLAGGREGEFLVASDEQTAGRGRQGKSFYSPAKTGVYFTLVLRPYAPLQNAVTATTAASVAVCKAIEELTDIVPKIKWVNDVYVDGKKICGILTEAITNFEEGIVDSIIIGIGINLSTSEFPDDVIGAGALNCEVDKNALVAKITDELMNIAMGDYKSFIDYYRSHSMVIGENIKFIENQRVTEARAVAIDEAGGLVVELQNGETKTLRSGEISIRRI